MHEYETVANKDNKRATQSQYFPSRANRRFSSGMVMRFSHC